ARDVQEPAFEGTECRIVFQSVNFFRDCYERFLDDLLRLAFRQAGLARGAVDDFPIGIEELLPAFPIVPIGQTLHQALARRKEFSAAHSSPLLARIPWRAKFFLNR